MDVVNPEWFKQDVEDRRCFMCHYYIQWDANLTTSAVIEKWCDRNNEKTDPYRKANSCKEFTWRYG